MNFNKELIEKAKNAASAEELLEFAKANGVDFSASDAEGYFNFLKNGSQPLSEDEMDDIAGGKQKEKTKPKYYVGQKLWQYFSTSMNWLELQITEIDRYSDTDGWHYYYRCLNLEGQPMHGAYLDYKSDVYTYDPRREKFSDGLMSPV